MAIAPTNESAIGRLERFYALHPDLAPKDDASETKPVPTSPAPAASAPVTNVISTEDFVRPGEAPLEPTPPVVKPDTFQEAKAVEAPATRPVRPFTGLGNAAATDVGVMAAAGAGLAAIALPSTLTQFGMEQGTALIVSGGVGAVAGGVVGLGLVANEFGQKSLAQMISGGNYKPTELTEEASLWDRMKFNMAHDAVFIGMPIGVIGGGLMGGGLGFAAAAAGAFAGSTLGLAFFGEKGAVVGGILGAAFGGLPCLAGAALGAVGGAVLGATRTLVGAAIGGAVNGIVEGVSSGVKWLKGKIFGD